MSKIGEIKNRITGVQKTKKITQALNMVAAAKFRKAQDNLYAARPYSDKLYALIDKLTSQMNNKNNVFFSSNDLQGKIGLVVIAGDKGLCGSFNNNIFKRAGAFMEEHSSGKIELVLVGNKACLFFKQKDHPVIERFFNFFDKFTAETARQVSDCILDKYLKNDWSVVYVVYNDFKSAITQKTLLLKILPIDDFKAGNQVGSMDSDTVAEEKQTTPYSNYLFEPSKQEVLQSLLSKHIHFQVYRMCCESITSEQAARMTSMESATDNANEMINMLTLRFNRERQALITTEIAEIVGGAEALIA